MRVMELQCRQTNLPQVIAALRKAGSLARRLHGGNEQRYQHANDGNDDKELHQCEREPAVI
jgi:hypothetical protein